jgi:hypothetical protein
MSSHRLNYLRLIEAEARRHGNFTNWVEDALKAEPVILNERHAADAAERFLSRLLGDCPATGDERGVISRCEDRAPLQLAA